MPTVTAHAARRSDERAVSAREIALTLRRPSRVIRHPSGALLCMRGNCTVVTDDKRKTVVTVYRNDR